MGLSIRRFFVATDSCLYRMANSKFERMLHQPGKAPIAIFANQRIRCAELLIELVERKPHCVLRQAFSIFQFDDRGCVDMDRYEEQQFALARTTLDPVLAAVLGHPKPLNNVLDASNRFIAQGGRWTPSAQLQHQLERVALGLEKCPAL